MSEIIGEIIFKNDTVSLRGEMESGKDFSSDPSCISECTLKCNFFAQPGVLHEQISDQIKSEMLHGAPFVF